MKLNNETLKIVFDYIDNQLNDDHGEYDNETDLLVAVKSAINHIEENDLDIEPDYNVKTAQERADDQREIYITLK
jgi:hypothetical protein